MEVNSIEKELIKRCMYVIVSCRTESQLKASIKYASLAYKKINNAGNRNKFTMMINRSIGFAQCNIKHKIGVE